MRSGLGTYNRAPIAPRVSYETDFNRICFSATDNTNEWFATLDSGTVALADSGTNGLVVITTDADDNDVVNMQMPGEAYKLAAGKATQFSFKNLKVADASESVFFVGLSITDAEILNGTGTGEGAVTDAVGFMWDGTDLFAVASKNGTATWTTKTDTGVTVADDTYIEELTMVFDGGGKCMFYVDGALVATIEDQASTKTAYPDDEDLTPTIEMQNTDASAEVMTLDYFEIAMDR